MKELAPSTMLVPLPGSKLPEKWWVKKKLGIAFSNWEESETDEDLPEDIPWILGARINEIGGTVFIWPEMVDDLPGEAWWTSDDINEAERDSFSDCGIGLVVEVQLDGEDPRKLWRRQLAVAMAFSEKAPLLFDDNSMRMITKRRADSIMEIPTYPSAKEMISIHVVYEDEDDKHLWIHTHGMDRSGYPDLEMFAVPIEYQNAAVNLVGLVADRLMDGTISKGLPVSIGPDIMLELMELRDALPLLSEGALGGIEDRDDNHGFPRLVIVQAAKQTQDGLSFIGENRRNLDLGNLLESLVSQDVIFYSDVEIERMSYLARYRWPLFLSLWRRSTNCNDRFYLKISLDTRKKYPREEHLWFEVQEIKQSTVIAILVNEPIAVIDYAQDETYELATSEISDWSATVDGETYDPIVADQLMPDLGVQTIAPKPVH